VRALLAALAAAVLTNAMTPASPPIVIGHRGASGDRPEHTLESYRVAIEQGADYIEPDLVSTRDGVLVARHENEISGTTDVASRPEFAGRRATKTIDGVPVTGWFTEDFTLAELKTLRAKERLPQLRGTAYDGRFEIPTFREVLDLAKQAKGRRIGVYPETKHPSYFDGIGLSLEEPLVKALDEAGLRGRDDLVFIQSFEVGNLKDLARRTRVRLVQLVDASGRPYDFTVKGDARTYADLVTPAGLREIATYAQGIGVNKNVVRPRDSQDRLLPATSVVRDAHAAGLVVHAWTFRAENFFLPTDFRSAGGPQARGDMAAEVRAFLAEGLDGLFTDNPGLGRDARDAPAPSAAERKKP
jgi:glycerophosphoryl diester phosphodiesterase